MLESLLDEDCERVGRCSLVYWQPPSRRGGVVVAAEPGSCSEHVELLPSLHRRAPALYMYKLPLGTGIIVHVPVHDVHVLGNRPSFSFSKSI